MKINLKKPFYISEQNKDDIDTQLRKQTRRFWGFGTPTTVVEYDKKCPLCGSYCLWSLQRRGTAEPKPGIYCSRSITIICPQCQACTVDDPLIPDNDNPPIQITPYMAEWVKCLHCRRRFNYTNRSSYRKGRHCTCGQRLIIDHLVPSHQQSNQNQEEHTPLDEKGIQKTQARNQQESHSHEIILQEAEQRVQETEENIWNTSENICKK